MPDNDIAELKHLYTEAARIYTEAAKLQRLERAMLLEIFRTLKRMMDAGDTDLAHNAIEDTLQRLQTLHQIRNN